MPDEKTTTTKQEQEPAKTEWEKQDEELDRQLEEFYKEKNAGTAAPEGSEEDATAKEGEETKVDDGTDGDKKTDDEDPNAKKAEGEEKKETESQDTPFEQLKPEEMLARYNSTLKELEDHREKLATATKRHEEATKKVTEATMSAASLLRQNEALTEVIKRREALSAGRSKTERPGQEGGEEGKKTDDFDTVFSELEKWDQEIAGKLRPVVQALQQTVKDQAKKIDELSGNIERVDTTTSELAESGHYDTIAKGHSDWKEVLNTDEFLGFVKDMLPTQAREAARILDRGSATEIVDLISDFKRRTGWKAGGNGNKQQTTTTVVKKEEALPEKKTIEKEDKLEKAKREATPPSRTIQRDINQRGKGVPKFTRKQIRDMDDETFLSKEPEIDAALKAGLVW